MTQGSGPINLLSAMGEKKTLMRVYGIATEEKYKFLYINMLGNDADHMFHWNLDKRLIVSRMVDDQT